MKKQKFCYSRFLSIILSLALLCSALVFPVSVNAANTPEDPKAAAAENLKTAWQEMYAAKGETFAYPNAISNKGTWVDCQGEGDRTLLPSEDPRLELYSDIDLGKYDNSSDVYVGYGKEFHGVNEKGDPVPYNGIILQASQKGDHGSREGFYFYVYAENVTQNIQLKLNLGWYGNAPTLSPETVTIPAGTNGYIRFKDTDFFPDGFHSVIGTATIYTMWVNVLAGFDKGAKLKFGSFQWVNNNKTLNLDYPETDDLLVSALKLHTDNVYYPEYIAKFEEALAALKACYGAKDLAVFELKAAWEEMEKKSGVWGTYNDSAYTGVEEITLNSTKYYKLDTGNLADTTNNDYTKKQRIYLSDKSHWKPVSNYGDGFYFYIYANEDIKAPITIAMHGGMIDGNSIKSGSYDLYYTIPAGTKAGTYIKVSDRDLFTEGYKTFKEMFGTSDGQNTFAIFFTSHGDSEISFGPAYYYTRVTSSDATGVDFVNAADALNTTSYGNTEAFTAALANAKAAYPDVFTASDLKAAFKDMLPDKNTAYTDDDINRMSTEQLLVAATSLHTNYDVYDAEKLATFKTALGDFKAANFTPEKAAKINLEAAYGVLQTSVAQYSSLSTTQWWGSKQAGVTISNTTANTPEREHLGTRYAELGNNETFTAGRVIRMQPDAGDKPQLYTYNGFYFYIQVTEKLTQDFEFSVANKFSDSVDAGENFCKLPRDTEPGYYLFTDRDFYSQGYNSVKDIKNANGSYIARGDEVSILLKSNYSGGNIRIGAVFGYKCEATVPGDFVNWKLDRCVNYLLRDINENSRKTTDEFNALFEEVKQMCAGKLYNGDFSGANSGYQLNTKAARPELGQDGKPVYDEEGNPVYAETETKYEFSSDNLVYTVDGWNKNLFDTYFSVEKNTNYVLTYRYKSETKNAQWQAFGVGLLDGSGTIINGEITHNNADIFTDAKNFDNTNWINGLCNTNNAKWINVSISFNSGENTFLKLNAASMGRNQYTIDYFKLTKASDVEIGNVNRDSEVDILDLVVLKEFLNDGDTEIAFEAAKVNTTGETVDNDDFKALRSKLLNSNS